MPNNFGYGTDKETGFFSAHMLCNPKNTKKEKQEKILN
jgi:hypothetical protein